MMDGMKCYARYIGRRIFGPEGFELERNRSYVITVKEHSRTRVDVMVSPELGKELLIRYHNDGGPWFRDEWEIHSTENDLFWKGGNC